MNLNVEQNRIDDWTVELCLEGDITVYTIKILKEVMTEALEQMNRIEINLNGIKKFDTTGFQLFEYMSLVATKLKKKIHISGVSDEVKKIYSACGKSI